jgi:hypothetical protein
MIVRGQDGLTLLDGGTTDFPEGSDSDFSNNDSACGDRISVVVRSDQAMENSEADHLFQAEG